MIDEEEIDFENNEFRKAGKYVKRTWAVIKKVIDI